MTDHDPAASIRSAIKASEYDAGALVLFASERTWEALCHIYGAADPDLDSDAETYAGAEVDFTAMPFGMWAVVETDQGSLVGEGRIGDALKDALTATREPVHDAARIKILVPGAPDSAGEVIEPDALTVGAEVPVTLGIGGPVVGEVIGTQAVEGGILVTLSINDLHAAQLVTGQAAAGAGAWSIGRPS